jgi:phosphoglycolate phosphatase-like HAD superfamily hydrolase
VTTLTVYKNSPEFSKIANFGGIVFDCDGVLIDSSGSYDKALTFCSKAFASILTLDFQEDDLVKTIEKIRELGAFNNDWDTQAVIVDYLYSKSKDTGALDELSQIDRIPEQLRYFESLVIEGKQGTTKMIGFEDLRKIVSGLPEGTNRDKLSAKVLKDDSLAESVSDLISYPKPVGEGFLATLFDELVYGKKVFREMYGFDCETKSLSEPGFIVNEKKLVKEDALVSFFSASGGNLGIITGRPRIPTLQTLGDSFQRWFRRSDLCLFTGDYILDVEDVKPSGKPMLKVAKNLPQQPILYVGDSGEDLLMTKNANKDEGISTKVYFAGIASSKEKADYFASEDGYVDCVVSDVNELGSLLEQNSSNSNNKS